MRWRDFFILRAPMDLGCLSAIRGRLACRGSLSILLKYKHIIKIDVLVSPEAIAGSMPIADKLC